MSSSHQLYQRVFTKLHALHPTLHQKRLADWIWVIVGLIQSQSVQLSAIANHIPSDGQAAGRIARFRRWLASKWIVSRTLYHPLIHGVLQAWRAREITIILDGCFLRHKRLQILRVSLSHCYRALPLAREVSTSQGLVALGVFEAMLEYVASLLRLTRRVTFLADRGFRDRDWARKCRTLGWDYIIRIANNTAITFPGGVQHAADELGIKKGERHYLPNVRITLDADWTCNLAITWTRATATCPAELCVVMANLRPSGWVLPHYLKRMHIEESVRDDKSGGFEMEASHLSDPKRLGTLLLALSVAVLWIYQIGERALQDDQRREIDPAYKRQLSVFQLGWRVLRRLISCAESPVCTLQLKPFKPEPVWLGKC
jgi:hypothetical protein